MTCWQTMPGPNKAQGGDCPWLSPLAGLVQPGSGVRAEQRTPSEPPELVGAVAVL